MSAKFYGKFWIATKDDINEILLREKVLPHLEPITDKNIAHRLISSLYARYVILSNNLSEIYDQTLQVQKREVIEKLLTFVNGRLFEWQKEIMSIEMSNFIYVDDALMELKLIPQEIQFLRPFHFPLIREKSVQDVIDAPDKPKKAPPEPTEDEKETKKLAALMNFDAEEESDDEEFDMKTLEYFDENEGVDDPLSFEDAVNIIKSHEKAKQARIFFTNSKHHPERFDIEKRTRPVVKYEFSFNPEDFPPRQPKVEYKKDFYQEIIDFTRVSFYEKPIYEMNKRGQLRRVKKVKEVPQEPEKIPSISRESLFNKEMREKEAQEEQELEAQKAEELDKKRNEAARLIQRNFLSYKFRRDFEGLIRHKHFLYGMIEVNDVITANIKKKNAEYREKRRQRKAEFDEKFLQAVQDDKARILKIRSPYIMEDISDHVREWFREFYVGAKDFHRYPEDFEGGTILMVRGETQTIEEFLTEKKKTKEQRAEEKEKRAMEKQNQQQEKQREAARLKRLQEMEKKQEMKDGKTYNYSKPKFQTENIIDLFKSWNDYEEEWKFVDESQEGPIHHFISLENYAQVHQELHPIVDEFMRIELELLRKALAKDKKKKYKPQKPKKPKKGKRERMPKKVFNATDGKSLEECFDELKEMNIIRKYPRRDLDDFIGEFNYAGLETRILTYKYPPPFYGDVKGTLRSKILGMGPVTMPKPKSLCIAGPQKCGKKMLVEALCSEMDAVMFDLSADKILPVTNMKYFMSLVDQVARKLQPSVFFIDGAHKPFIKKMTPEDKPLKPKKLGKHLFKKLVKMIKPEDRVMLMGTSNEPWNCKFGKFKKCFENFVIFPGAMDYSTSFLLWQKSLMKKNICHFNCSTIANLTRRYAPGDIIEIIEKQLSLRRRMILYKSPLTNQELLNYFIDNGKKPATDDIIEKFEKFSLKFDKFKKERNEWCEENLIELAKQLKMKQMQKERAAKEAAAKVRKQAQQPS